MIGFYAAAGIALAFFVMAMVASDKAATLLSAQ